MAARDLRILVLALLLAYNHVDGLRSNPVALVELDLEPEATVDHAETELSNAAPQRRSPASLAEIHQVAKGQEAEADSSESLLDIVASASVNVTSDSETAASVCINDKYIRTNAGAYYRRQNAMGATLAAYGNRDRFGSKMRFKSQGNPQWLMPTNQKVIRMSVVELNADESAKFNADGQVTRAIAKAQANGGVKSSGSAKFKAVFLKTSVADLVDAINADKKHLARLRSYDLPRVVTQVIRLETPGTFGDEACFSGGASAGVSVGSGNASGKVCSTMSAVFSTGTVIGFVIAEPKWADGKASILDLEVDPPCDFYDMSCGCNSFR